MNPKHQYSTKKKNLLRVVNDWLESHWATPAYSGWILLAISLCFFGAATNTMAGWLYVLSGILFSLLGLNIFVARQTLNKLLIKRSPIEPVSAGDELTIELIINNPTKTAKTLLQIIDQLPSVLSPPVTTSIETIPPQETIKWIYYAHSNRRGIYHWHDLDIKTAAPLGLFSCRRQRQLETKAIVYPQVLPLKVCPLIDNLGAEETRQQQSERLYQSATEGVTKGLRQYRFGDPIRLIHWRSSAKFDNLQVRELETITGGEEVIIALDNSSDWQDEYFEQAVIAAASMYFYASRQQLNVNLWTAETGIVHGSKVVLETLAEVEFGTGIKNNNLPSSPLIWLSSNNQAFDDLPKGSRWFLFAGEATQVTNASLSGIVYSEKESLESQLQKPLRR